VLQSLRPAAIAFAGADNAIPLATVAIATAVAMRPPYRSFVGLHASM
jgi:hypothetical protein